MHVKDIAHCPEAMLTLSALQTKIDIFAKSVDPDKTARNEPSHLKNKRKKDCLWKQRTHYR